MYANRHHTRFRDSPILRSTHEVSTTTGLPTLQTSAILATARTTSTSDTLHSNPCRRPHTQTNREKQKKKNHTGLYSAPEVPNMVHVAIFGISGAEYGIFGI